MLVLGAELDGVTAILDGDAVAVLAQRFLGTGQARVADLAALGQASN